MPFKSDAQRRLFYAAAGKKAGIGDLAQSTAKKFIKDASKEKSKDLPEKVGRFNNLKNYLKKGNK